MAESVLKITTTISTAFDLGENGFVVPCLGEESDVQRSGHILPFFPRRDDVKQQRTSQNEHCCEIEHFKVKLATISNLQDDDRAMATYRCELILDRKSGMRRRSRGMRKIPQALW